MNLNVYIPSDEVTMIECAKQACRERNTNLSEFVRKCLKELCNDRHAESNDNAPREVRTNSSVGGLVHDCPWFDR